MPYGTFPIARQLEHGKSNRFLAALPPHDFSLLAPHLRTIPLERGTMLHDVGEGKTVAANTPASNSRS
jgi:hypothetical protein